ncbi:MAG: hypothetical protein VCF24_23125 [Candidatus Latescibacterota bacterium]
MTGTSNRLIISNDDGWIMSNMTGPVTPETIASMMVDTYPGSPIGGISWCVGNSETYEFETEVGERTGDGYEHFETPREEWMHRNLYALIESDGGPLSEINRQFAQAGVDVFPSMRMNSHYEIDYASPGHGKFRREHPDWLIGQPYEEIPFPTVENAIARGLDYKFPGVREHILSVVIELIERFDVAGIELDYFRHPAFFRVEEAYSNRYLMTDFVRQIRQRLDEVGKDRGKHLDLLVRVPSSPYDSKRIGLDIEVWIKEGLVDIVAAGGGFLPFEQPIGDFVEIADGTDCLIYGSFEALRWALDEEVLYALAARCWEAGVDGFYLFNYFNTPNEWKRRVLGNMVDREKLPRLDKRYELDHSDRHSMHSHSGAFLYATAWASLPVFMEETQPGGGSVLTLDIADDVEGAKADGALTGCTLSLGFDRLAEDDELEVRLNGHEVVREAVSHDGWQYTIFDGQVYHTTMTQNTEEGTLITFDATDAPITKGQNELVVRLIKGKSSLQPVTLKEVRLNIRYKGKG